MPSTNDLYAAQVNPSRRAKSSSYSSHLTSASSTDNRAQAQLPQVHPNPPQSPLTSPVLSAQPHRDEPTPSVGRKRRGRKPGSGAAFPSPSRAAREAARRESHSRIEKARRGKINDALDALRAMVPSDCELISQSENPVTKNSNDQTAAENESDRQVRTSKTGDSKPKQSEFKLDILERTVIFMRALLERVEHLENDARSYASPSGGFYLHPNSKTTVSSESMQSRGNGLDVVGAHSAGVAEVLIEEVDVEERASKRRRLDDASRKGESISDGGEDEDSTSEEEDEMGTSISSPISSEPLRFSLPSIHSLLEISTNSLLPPASNVHASTNSSFPHSYLPSPSLSPLVCPRGSGSISPTFRSKPGLISHEAYLPSPSLTGSSSTSAHTSTSPTSSAVSSSSHAAHPHSPFPHLPAPALTNASSRSKRYAPESSPRATSWEFTSPSLETDHDHHEQTLALTLLQMRSHRTPATEVKATPSSILGINHQRRRESQRLD